jgi:hypothetical protein
MNTVQEVLDACTIEGNNVFLPDAKLDRKLYTDVNKKLTGIGGKWSRKEKAHVFPNDPNELFGRVTAGEKINLKKDYQFFETPMEMANDLVDLLFDDKPWKAHHHILEPQAGQGRLVEALHDYHFQNKLDFPYLDNIHLIELMENNYKELQRYYEHPIKNMDFLKYNKLINYFDFVIGNPPFTKGQDIEHFKHMYKVCATNGVVVCVMSASWVSNSTKKFKDFRKWLGFDEDSETDRDKLMRKEMSKGSAEVSFTRKSEHGNSEEILIKSYPAGTFKSSGTNVITTVIRLKKNDVSGF